ncbi:hypothetical protein [Rikenella microfusus]|uniref:AhpC/TSA family n=1 Tax=Rikenella microfusus TaxID=28139 RepID=A0A379MQY8_9BACT|nr:hypothetical protein [Rikenella microfusus]SUE33955.1 Uncharacterised protein [Rikenella microfusus]
MKGWERFTVLFLILSVGVNIFLIFRIFDSRTDIERLSERLRVVLTPEQRTLSWERYFASMIAYQDFCLEGKTAISMDGRSFSLDSLIDGPTLVFRYKSTDCGQCIDFALLKLKKMAIGQHIRMLVLAAEPDRRNVKILRRRHGFTDIPFYQVQTLDTPAEEVQYPYCFVMDKDMYMKSVFIPDKSYPYSMDLYLKMIGKRYFSVSDAVP